MTDDSDAGHDATTPYQRMLRVGCARITACGQPPTVAETARDAGVAPEVANQMFADDVILLTAILENALVLLTAEVTRATTALPTEDPVVQFRAMVGASVDWVVFNPEWGKLILHSELFRSRHQDFHRYNDALREMGMSLLRRAEADGRLRDGRLPDEIELASRAMAWGLMNMALQQPDPQPSERRAAMTNWPISAKACHQAFNILLDAMFLSPQSHAGTGAQGGA